MNKNFLDTDHEISLDKSVKIINAEIQWCYQNPMEDISSQFREGFIKGLEQAKSLLIEVAIQEEIVRPPKLRGLRG